MISFEVKENLYVSRTDKKGKVGKRTVFDNDTSGTVDFSSQKRTEDTNNLDKAAYVIPVTGN